MNETPADLSGVDLLLASPCGTGRYEREYVKSFIRSFIALTRWGAKFEWADMPYCADLALARAKIFGKFLRSNHTHLMMVDDDMGWKAEDIGRLLAMRRDFVAGVGVKKTDPYEALQFCFAPSDAVSFEFDEHTFTLNPERHTGLLDVARVGAAFVLITRAMAERMAECYQDLAFVDDGGLQEYAIFDPEIIDRKRSSEDYAFCSRWRRIGGHIHILPDIRLKHVGSYTWEAALTDAAPSTDMGALRDVA